MGPMENLETVKIKMAEREKATRVHIMVIIYDFERFLSPPKSWLYMCEITYALSLIEL